MCILVQSQYIIVFVWSDKLGANQKNRTKAVFGARNNEFVGGATC